MRKYLSNALSNGTALILVVLFTASQLVAGSVVSRYSNLTELALNGNATNFSSVQVGDGSASAPSFSFTNDTDTGAYLVGSDNIGFSAGGTLAFDINSDGTIDQAQDVTFSKSILQTLVNAASGSANPYDYTGTLGIMNGSDTFTLFDINVTNANHTGTSNVAEVMNVANITGDADSQENIFNLGSGWDVDINCTTTCDWGIGDTVVSSQSTTALSLRNSATGSISIDLRDYADTTDDDMAHTSLTTNCTDTSTGAEDCDFTLGIVEAGAAAETRLNFDADGGITLGSANNNSVTLTTDSTGDGEVVLPGSSVSAGEIVDVSRNINVTLTSFIDCQTDGGADLTYISGADTIANYVNSATDGTGFVITFDDTGATEDQSSELCAQFTIPPDYASGGAFIVRASKDAHAGATEVINCAVSVNQAALQAAGTVTTSASASTSYTCTPTISALAAGDSVSFYLSITSGTTMDDAVSLSAVAFQYVATQ